MKKIISIILILTMLVAMSLPTFALSSGTTPEYKEVSKDGEYGAYVEYGASKNVYYDAKPHVGTDKLRDVVKGIREKIIRFALY